jgi:hypothetical protein
LRAARQARGWTQAELATRLGMAWSSVAQWETRETLTEVLETTGEEQSLRSGAQNDVGADARRRRKRVRRGSSRPPA